MLFDHVRGALSVAESSPQVRRGIPVARPGAEAASGTTGALRISTKSWNAWAVASIAYPGPEDRQSKGQSGDLGAGLATAIPTA